MTEKPEITETEEITKMLKKAATEKFWGKITFGFQNGTITLIRKEKTTRAKINFD
jgi:hypothetical protein